MPVRIENWSIVTPPGSDGYTDPAACGISLRGVISGHAKHADGKTARTSRIRGKRRGMVVTSKTEYELGAVDPQYEAVMPNAKNRLMNTLPELL
jgi:hypothetical protein